MIGIRRMEGKGKGLGNRGKPEPRDRKKGHWICQTQSEPRRASHALATQLSEGMYYTRTRQCTVTKNTMTAWPAFLGFGRRTKSKGITSRPRHHGVFSDLLGAISPMSGEP
jgi:hypothetical protein